MQDLREKTIRAIFANVFGRGMSVLLRVLSIVILGRLLGPVDYGLVSIVTSVISVRVPV